jgi:hypothetical protein
MAALIVNTKNKAELQLLQTMLKKMGITSRVVSESDKEDIALGLLVQQADRAKKSSRNSILKKLAN